MPNQTFFRLSEEKRRRLTEAAWKEFRSVRYSEASINRVIHEAAIPRGSFYQYFEDKEDLFFYLLGSVREESFRMIDGALRETEGDPFSTVLLLFDRMFDETGHIRPSLARVLSVLQLNHDMDVTQMILRHIRTDEEALQFYERFDWSRLRRQDRDFLRDLSALTVFSFADALRGILLSDSSRVAERERLASRLDLIRRGSEKQEERAIIRKGA